MSKRAAWPFALHTTSRRVTLDIVNARKSSKRGGQGLPEGRSAAWLCDFVDPPLKLSPEKGESGGDMSFSLSNKSEATRVLSVSTSARTTAGSAATSARSTRSTGSGLLARVLHTSTVSPLECRSASSTSISSRTSPQEESTRGGKGGNTKVKKDRYYSSSASKVLTTTVW